jgi:anti-anti-sigma regulatory factor
MRMSKSELNLYDAESLYTEILQELGSGDLHINMQGVNTIDMSIIQLLISAQKSCLSQNKAFVLENVNAELSNIFEKTDTGFLQGKAS